MKLMKIILNKLTNKYKKFIQRKLKKNFVLKKKKFWLKKKIFLVKKKIFW
jgi:hypothetical protein